MTAEKKPLESVRRALKIIFLLQGHTFEGLRLKTVADHLQTTMATAHRDLATLADEGVAERIPGRDDYWRLTPKLIQIARAHDIEMTRLRSRVEEIDQRYTREPR